MSTTWSDRGMPSVGPSAGLIVFHAVGRAIAIAIYTAFWARHRGRCRITKRSGWLPGFPRIIGTTGRARLGCSRSARTGGAASGCCATNTRTGRSAAARSACSSAGSATATTSSTAAGASKGCGRDDDHCSCQSCFEFHAWFSMVSVSITERWVSGLVPQWSVPDGSGRYWSELSSVWSVSVAHFYRRDRHG